MELSMQEKEGAPPSDHLAAAPITVRQPPGSSARDSFDEIRGDRESGCSLPAGNRWPRQETMALLKIRSDMDPLFQEATLKAPLWEEVSRKLREEGFQRSAKKCKEKFENVFKYYKRTKEARAGKSYRFFSQLEAFRTPSAAAVAEIAAAPALLPPIVTSSATMVNFEASSSGAAASSQHNLFSVTAPPPLPAAAVPVTIPTIAPPPTDATDGPSSSSNTSSYSGTESEDGDERDASRKRKRKLRGGGDGDGDEGPEESGKLMAFFESLIQKVMDQQEKMLQRFLEAIERREQNRMIREEAWRRQEKSRLSREHELAAQERAAAASRDDAIISFLQKLTGQKIPIPPPPQPPPTTTALAEETQSSPPTSPPPPPPENPDQPPKVGSSSRTRVETILSSRWPKAEVHALIKLRSGLESRYEESIPKGPLWEEISAGMLRLGYNRNAKRCKEKWENINKYFKKVKESNKNRAEDAKTCPYFHQLDALYRSKLLIGGSSSAGTAGRILSADDHLAIISPTTSASTRQQDDLLGFFEQGSGSISPVKKPEDIVKKKMDQAIVEPEIEKKENGSSFQFRAHHMMPRLLSGVTGQNSFLAMVR